MRRPCSVPGMCVKSFLMRFAPATAAGGVWQSLLAWRLCSEGTESLCSARRGVCASKACTTVTGWAAMTSHTGWARSKH